MEARIVELKGSPEEIANVLRTVPGLEQQGTNGAEKGPQLPEDVRDWLSEWGVRGTQRRAFEIFVQQALQLNDVRVRITAGREGGDSDTAGRIGFVRNGSNKSFAFIHYRGKLFVRLPSDTDVSDFPHASQRDIKPKPGSFGVTMYVRTEGAVEEAVQLFRRAYEEVGA